MPSVIAGALVSAVGLTGIAGTVATALIGAGASIAINSVAGSSAKKPRPAADRAQMIRSATAPRRVVYGQARVSGPLVFAYSTNSASGQKNFLLHLVVPLAGHEVAEVGSIFVNEEEVVPRQLPNGWHLGPAGSRYCKTMNADGAAILASLQWRVHEGAANQAADTALMAAVPSWTAQHRLANTAYIYAKLFWDNDVWAGGLPNLSAIVKGRPVFDPRTGQTGWSNNPALCLRDYLLAPFGLACAADEIDEASFIAAANLCDEPVPVASGGEQKRYTCDGSFTLDEKPIEIVEKMLSCCAGSLVYTQGTYKLFPAAYRAPVLALGAGDLRAAVVVRPKPTQKQRITQVRGSFIDPQRGWQPADFPPVKLLGQTETLARDLELPFTIDSFAAQRLARLQLQRAQQSLAVEAPCTMAALAAAVMEPLTLSLPQLDWENKVFLPTEWTLAEGGGVDLVLVEESPAVYAWDGGVAGVAPPAVVLPSIYPDPPLLQLTDELVSSAGASTIQLTITLLAPLDAFHSRFEVEYRLAGAPDWQAAAGGTVATVQGVREGEVYEVRARAVNVLGLVSAWTSKTRQIVGTAAPPPDVVSLATSLIDSTLYLDWPKVAGLVERYRVRWSPLLVGADWASAIDIAANITNTRAAVPARVGTYFVKAVDPLGRESVTAASATNTVADPVGLNLVASLTEHSAFTGSKTNCVVNGSAQLVIDSLSAFEAQAGNFDALAGNFDVAGGGTSPEGIYNFSAVLDLAQIYIARASAQVQVGVIDLVTETDMAAGLFDAREGQFDGTAPSAVDVVLEVATTTDNPAVSPVWSSWQKFSVGDYTARGFRFRARLLSSNSMATPAISALSVRLEMPDRVTAGSDVVSSASGTSITFSPAFKATPALTIAPADLATGDTYSITSKSRSGFTVQFKNSSGVGVVRTFDWSARGYGRQQ